MPNQYSQTVSQAGFGEIILGQNPQTFMIPIYSTTVLYEYYIIQYTRTRMVRLVYATTPASTHMHTAPFVEPVSCVGKESARLSLNTENVNETIDHYTTDTCQLNKVTLKFVLQY